MSFLNIAGYQFVAIPDYQALRAPLLAQCQSLSLKGTILLSQEGINLNLSGTVDAIAKFKTSLNTYTYFSGMTFREGYSETQPFKRLKIKLKKEIITLRQPKANPIEKRAPAILPETLKQWLDEKREFTLLDTRNDYEVELGTFQGAVNLHLKHFCDLPKAVQQVKKDKPIVMFCTGGIRCEKAALYMQQEGYETVYQLDGGILNYFAMVGGDHYDGACYVFDERVTVSP